jgi:anti-sigma factor RsiW
MTRSSSDKRPTDAELVAYLDGELTADRRAAIASSIAEDRELQARLALLASGGRPFRQAFEPLLAEAPRAKLADMLAGLPEYRASAVAETGQPLLRHPWRRIAWPRLFALAAGVVLFFAGATVDRFLPQLLEAVGINLEGESEEDWRQAVAEYISLYTPETVASTQDNTSLSERELTAVGTKLGIPLPLDRLSLPGLVLKRSQLLQYDEKPLGQVIYLDPQDGIVALCIYAESHPDTPQSSEQRAGMNVVHWSSRDRAFMLVGRMAISQLQRLANLLSQQLVL